MKKVLVLKDQVTGSQLNRAINKADLCKRVMAVIKSPKQREILINLTKERS